MNLTNVYSHVMDTPNQNTEYFHHAEGLLLFFYSKLPS